MNYKYIIGFIVLISVIGAVWIWDQSPDRLMRPAHEVQPQQAVSASEADLMDIFRQVICPEPECKTNGENLAICDCETAREVKSQISAMLAQGLTKTGVLSHLKLMGLVPGDPGLPAGHPPIGGSASPDTSLKEVLPPGHPPVAG